MKYYIHHTPGRIRIQTPALHDTAGKAGEFRKRISIDGISGIDIHPATGSAIIRFDSKRINCEQIICLLEKYGYFELSEAETVDHLIERITDSACKLVEAVAVDCIEAAI